MIIAGGKMKEVAITKPSCYVKFRQGLDAFKSVIMDPPNEKPNEGVYVEKTGVGKSRIAREVTQDPYAVPDTITVHPLSCTRNANLQCHPHSKFRG